MNWQIVVKGLAIGAGLSLVGFTFAGLLLAIDWVHTERDAAHLQQEQACHLAGGVWVNKSAGGRACVKELK